MWKDETLGPGLKRVLLRCLVLADKAVATDLRAARVRIKRARAVLRMAEALGAPWAATARRDLARLARNLGATRNHRVVVDLAGACVPALKGKARLCALALIETPCPSPNLAEWTRALARHRASLASKPWPTPKRDQLDAVLDASLRQARRQARHAAKGDSFHTWRTSVITLREQLNVVDVRLTRKARTARTHLHRVARILGDAGDWQTLIDALSNRHLPAACTGGRRRLIKHARRRQRDCLRKALGFWKRLPDFQR